MVLTVAAVCNIVKGLRLAISLMIIVIFLKVFFRTLKVCICFQDIERRPVMDKVAVSTQVASALVALGNPYVRAGWKPLRGTVVDGHG